MTCRILVAALFAAVNTTSSAAAQDTVREGERVRIRAGGHVVTGVLRHLDTAVVRVHSDSDTVVAIGIDDIRQIERSAGRGKFAKPFFVTVGVTAFVLGTVTALEWKEPDFMIGSRPEAFMLGAAAGAIVGIPLGLLAGAASSGEQWRPAMLPPVNALRMPQAAVGNLIVKPILGTRPGFKASVSF